MWRHCQVQLTHNLFFKKSEQNNIISIKPFFPNRYNMQNGIDVSRLSTSPSILLPAVTLIVNNES